MSNFSTIDFEEIEQDEMKEKLDLITITSAKNLDTLTGISSLQADAIVANTLKNTYPPTDALKVGRITIDGNINLNNINYITVTGAVNLDTIKSNVTAIKASGDETLTIGGNDESTNDLLIGEVPSSTTECGIGNKAAFTAGSSTPYMISQANDGSIKLKGHAVTITSAKDLDTMASNISTNNGKVSMVLGTTGSTALAGDTTTISATQATNISNNTTELANINVSSNIMLFKRLKVGENGTQCLIQHKDVEADDVVSSANCSIRILNNGKLRLNAPSSQNIEFRINNVKQFDDSDIKNLIDNISVSSSVNLDTIKSNVTAIKASSDETLTIGANDESTNDLLVGEVPTSTTECGIANKTSYTAGSSTPYMISQANDGSIKLKGHAITISSAKDLDTMASNISTNNSKTGITATQILNVNPLNNYIYGRRLRLLSAVGSATPTTIDLTSSLQTLVFQNIIANGVLTYDANGNLATSATGLFHIKAKVSVTTDSGTGGGERMCKFELQTSGGTSVINGKNHLSRHDSNNLSFAAPEIDAVVRLASGTDYIFRIESDDNGTGVVQNGKVENNDLIIRSLPIPSSYTLPSDYGED